MAAVDVYAICWNEERMLPYFLRHYGSFARRIVLFDNYSTDSSPSIANQHGKVELRRFGSPSAVCGEAERMPIRETAWQESRGNADWVMVVDCDEFIWHPCLLTYLQACRRRSVTVPRPLGFEMVSSDFPAGVGQIYQQVRSGVPGPLMNKWLLFDPNAIEAMHFSPGCHHASPTGNVVFDDDPELKLLHFKYLGIEYVSARYQQLARRRTAQDHRMGLNHHYLRSRDELAAWLGQALAEAQDVISPLAT